ncbi:MAG: Gfo/Idh/MocA family protein [Longimicrobiales bacterium]
MAALATREDGSLEPLKFGIVGCGRIGNRHAGHAANLGQLTAVCDILPERAENLAQEKGCAAYASTEDMLRNEPDMDVVAICTPNGLHASQTIQALKSGFHVLCEKPMAIRTTDCVEMIKVAEVNNRRLFIVKQNRYNPPIARVKDVIAEGRLGRILSAQLNCYWNRGPDYFEGSWKGTRDLDGGTLFTQFSHFIDLLYWLLGDVKNVHAFTQNAHHQGMIEFEDQGVAILEFAGGPLASVHFTVNAHGKNMEGSLTIFGEKGTVKVGGEYLNELEYQNIADYRVEGLPPGNPANDYGTYVGSMSNHDLVYKNVIDVLQKGGTIGTNGIEGLKTVQIIERIYEAAQRHG